MTQQGSRATTTPGRPSLRLAPPRLFGAGGRPDRTMTLLRTGIAAWSAIAQHSRGSASTDARLDTLAVTIVRTHRIAEDVVEIVFADPAGRPLPGWDPGAHIDVHAPSGRVRQYSLTGRRGNVGEYRIAVRRTGDGGVAAELHDWAATTVPLTISFPRNLFPFAHPRAADTPVCDVAFVACGIGITPIMSMIERCHDTGLPWRLTYLGDRRSRMPYLQRLEYLDTGGLRVIETTSRGRPSIDELVPNIHPGLAVYYCGPPDLATPLANDLRKRGVVHFHHEPFTAPRPRDGRPFDIVLDRSDIILTVDSTSTALDTVLRTRPATPYACRQGFCGSCRVRVLAGDVQRTGTATFLADDDTMLLCSDRATSDSITVDL